MKILAGQALAADNVRLGNELYCIAPQTNENAESHMTQQPSMVTPNDI
jgi:hypothetical protein